MSSEAASNARRIADEAPLVEAVRAAIALRRPRWRFRHQRLESLSYASEMRLLRRTALLVSLYGSSLHNCLAARTQTLVSLCCRAAARASVRAAAWAGRFLPDGAIVLQIHGALKGEISRHDAWQYPPGTSGGGGGGASPGG